MKGLYDPYGDLYRRRRRELKIDAILMVVGSICVVVCIVTTGLAILNSIQR